MACSLPLEFFRSCFSLFLLFFNPRLSRFVYFFSSVFVDEPKKIKFDSIGQTVTEECDQIIKVTVIKDKRQC